MYYELYVDSLLLVNFVMNLYLLILVNQSTHRTATRGRLILGALSGSVLYLLPFAGSAFGWPGLRAAAIPGMAAMVFVTFRIRNLRALITVTGKLLVYSLLLGGCLLLVIRALPMFRGGLTGILGIMGMGAMVFLFFFYGKEQAESGDLCRVTLSHRGRRVTVTALIDSGNSLTEPVSKCPVSIVDRQVFEDLWKEDTAYYRAVPYHSIGKKCGILQGYLLEEMRIELEGMVKICRAVYVAVAREEVLKEGAKEPDGVKLILNPVLLEKTRKTVKEVAK